MTPRTTTAFCLVQTPGLTLFPMNSRSRADLRPEIIRLEVARGHRQATFWVGGIARTEYAPPLGNAVVPFNTGCHEKATAILQIS
jgi:hypothetical protein